MQQHCLSENSRQLAQTVRCSVLHVATFPVASGGTLKLPDKLSKCSPGQPVWLQISFSGIDIIAQTGSAGLGETISSHPLRRISLASCDPGRCLFAFAARESAAGVSKPGTGSVASTNQTLCRVFVTQSAQAARELSSLIADCFESAASAAANACRDVTVDGGVLASKQRQKQQQQQQQHVVKPKPIPAPRLGSAGFHASSEVASNSYVASPIACRPAEKLSQQQAPPLPVRYDSLRCRPCDFEVPPPPPLPPDAIPNQPGASAAPTTIATVTDLDDLDDQQSWWWYRADLPREAAFKLLAGSPFGSFLVRNSSSHPNCYALSVCVPKQQQQQQQSLSHYLIQRTARGVKLKGLSKEWPNLHSLVCHLSVLPELLPCPLLLQPAPAMLQQQLRQRQRFQRHSPPHSVSVAEAPSKALPDQLLADESGLGDYQRLTDFNSLMMTNLRLL